MKKWYNVELEANEALSVTAFCKRHGIVVEASGMEGGLIHLEINCTEMEADKIDDFIDDL